MTQKVKFGVPLGVDCEMITDGPEERSTSLSSENV